MTAMPSWRNGGGDRSNWWTRGGSSRAQGGWRLGSRSRRRLRWPTRDVIVLVVDASVGPQADDLAVARMLRGAGKPVLLVANKVDAGEDEITASEFYALGLGDPIPVSALHGRGSGDFLDALLERLPEIEGETSDVWASIAIVGRPNVGKSSLLNALLGEERAIVDPTPGTTRDPVDSYLVTPEGQRVRVLDTAGMRRRVSIKEPLEYFSWLRSRRTLQRADVVLLVVDAAEGVTGPDQRIAEQIVDTGRACIIVLNKWDLVTTEETDRARVDRDIETSLRFLPWAKVQRTSALTGRGVDRLMDAITVAVGSHRRRLGTAEVNRIIAEAQQHRPAARSGGRSNRVLYAVQADIAPPRFILFSSHRLDESYVRFLEHRFRAVEPFEGTPIKLEVRRRSRRQVES